MQYDLFQNKTQEQYTADELAILERPDHGINEKHRKVPSIHALVKFNLKSRKQKEK